VRIAGSALATDTIGLHDRKNVLWLRAAELSAQRAMAQAGVTPDEIDLFELHDSPLRCWRRCRWKRLVSRRGRGLAAGAGWGDWANGRIPISTFGGLKARGNPIGATGIYQVVEVARQLRGQAGDCQVSGAKIGMAQNLGGSGATAVTHILLASLAAFSGAFDSFW
jgi:acetyl-CoA C-acetyltransferase